MSLRHDFLNELSATVNTVSLATMRNNKTLALGFGTTRTHDDLKEVTDLLLRATKLLLEIGEREQK